jgi:hypothetical protein
MVVDNSKPHRIVAVTQTGSTNPTSGRDTTTDESCSRGTTSHVARMRGPRRTSRRPAIAETRAAVATASAPTLAGDDRHRADRPYRRSVEQVDDMADAPAANRPRPHVGIRCRNRVEEFDSHRATIASFGLDHP